MTLDAPAPAFDHPLTDSGFYMWRCIVAVAQADGMVQDEELEYLNRIFAEMHAKDALSAEQFEILGEDLVQSQKVGELITHVTDQNDRHQLVYYAALMAQANGDLDPGEEEIIRKISAGAVSDAEVNKLMQDVRKALDDRHMKEALARAYAERPRGLRAIVRMVLNKIYS